MDVVELICSHYRENFKPLSSKAGRVLRDHALGEDVVQETYEAAYRYKHSFNPERGDMDKWIGKIFWRNISRYKSFAAGMGDLHPIMEVEVNPELTRQFLEESSLPDHYKMIIAQVYINGYSPKQVAKLMGEHSTSVIYKCVHLFKKEVRERYDLRS